MNRDSRKHFKIDLDRKLNPWLKFELNFLTWLPNGKIEKTTMHLLFSFYIIKKQTTTEKAFLFQNLSTWLESRPLPRLPPTLTNTKKSHLTQSIVYSNEAVSLVAMRNKSILIGPRISRHCQTWLERRFSWNENLQRKQNWTAKSTNFEENAGKKRQFLSSE